MSEPITRAACRFPFLDCAGCEQCATPVIAIPPETEFLRTRFAMLCVIGAALGILALVAFAAPHSFNRVVTAHQEDVL